MIYQQYGPHPLLGDGILDHQFLCYLQDIHRRFSMNGATGFFLRRFNTPDALICCRLYRKLKLLGATYLPFYMFI
jgi:hypothetical protein